MAAVASSAAAAAAAGAVATAQPQAAVSAGCDGAADDEPDVKTVTSVPDDAVSDDNDTGKDGDHIHEGILYESFKGPEQMDLVQGLINSELSEPYSMFTYRYFINNWPNLCFLAMDNDKCIGTIVCKLALDKKNRKRGYIAMLAVDKAYRTKQIGSHLVKSVVRAMMKKEADLVVLETEVTNKGALGLYGKLNFVRDKRMYKYYLNGNDAFRLKLYLTPPPMRRGGRMFG